MTKISKKKSQLKFYTLEQTFKKRGKAFERGYAAESTRIALAKKIREERDKKRLTQIAVARKANMPQSVIARIESEILLAGQVHEMRQALGENLFF